MFLLFYLLGETLEEGKVQNAKILSAEESVVLQAIETFTDTLDGSKITFLFEMLILLKK